ncbi:MAG: UvrD-helicase domain-containing protein [Chloracidobacterium sp.]|nr:UvrD-helicase domain-containing protein [Chloracidobacterium sp.]MDW8218433.1 UvrD-helicase domain-containing protein [Acidobacteriota bacterium]
MTVELDSQTGLTPTQQQAVETLNKPLVVTAGPGAGKTRVLTERYLWLLMQPGVGVENIVAVTFTNKAANEMRERIRRRIDAHIAAASGTAEELRWRQRKRHLEAAAIGTIHGFCSRLLREFPLEAGVDPYFATLDEYTATVMLDLAAQQAVTGAIDGGGALVAELVAAYGRAELVEALKQVFTQLRSLGLTLDEAERLTSQNTLAAADYDARWRETAARVDELRGIVADESAAKKPAQTILAAQNFLAVWTQEADALAQPPASERLPMFLAAVARLRQALPDARGKVSAVVKALQAWLGTRAKDGGQLEAAYLDVCARDYQRVVFDLLRSVDFLYDKAKREAGALDFEDLQLRARALLQSDDMRRRVCARYRHFLVDEFQDTNHLQRDILDALGAAESAAGRTFFFVGDRKQSIYAFRGAEVEVFEEVIEAVAKQGGDHLRLDVNFRSDPRLVAFFNALFGQVMRAPTGSDPSRLRESGFIAYEKGEAARPPLDAAAPAVTFLYTAVPRPEGGRSPHDDSLRDIEAARLAQYVKMLVERQIPLVNANSSQPRPPTYRDMALLLGALTDVKAYERALRHAGVPCYVVAGHGFYGRPEVSDLLTLLEFLDNRADDIALAALLRSPLFGLSDETLLRLRLADEAVGDGAARSPALYTSLRREVRQRQAALPDDQRRLLEEAVALLDDLLAVRNRLPLPDLIEQAVRRTGYDVVCAAAEDGPQRLSNLDKLMALARGFSRRETHLLRDFVAYIREFRRLDAREAEAQLELGLDAVALLTIHKSKGLEFPIVLLPDLQRRWTHKAGKFVFERNSGLGFDIPDMMSNLRRPEIKTKVLDRLARREYFERMRQLYVAMTRAQDHLILSAAEEAAGGDTAKGAAGCFLDWIKAALPLPDTPCETEIVVGDARIRFIGVDAPETAPAETIALEREPPSREVFVRETERDARRRERERRNLIRDLEEQLAPVLADEDAAAGWYRYTARQLASFVNCPRQFYFARYLHPLEDEEGGATRRGDDVERPEAQARLSPATRGLVIHRLCETLEPEDQDDRALHQALRAAIAFLRAVGQLDNVALDDNAIAHDVWWLARRYAQSELRKTVDEVRVKSREDQRYAVWSEREFIIRREAALVVGVMDKVLITPHATGVGVTAHVIDFKTNAFKAKSGEPGFEAELSEKVAQYRLQLQTYALALWALTPEVREVRATLHFVAPDRAFTLPPEQVQREAAARVVGDTVRALTAIRTFAATDFEAKPGARCLVCRYAAVCADAVREEPAAR